VRHRSGQNVAADDDPVGVRSSHLVENRFERGKVAVDVVEDGDADGAPAFLNAELNSRIYP
jgi:hypothetical protein